MKIIKLILLVFLNILILSSCQQQDLLVGKWERIGDKYNGMKVQVANEGGSFKAEIIAITDSIPGFVVGDIKWKDIKRVADKKYELQELGKKPTGFSDEFTGDYALARLEFISDTLIHTRLFSKGDEIIGTETNWKKIE